MIKVRDINFYIRWLKKEGKPFILEQTLYTKKIITETQVFYYNANSGLNNYELNLIKKVKDHVSKLPEKFIPKIDAKQIQFIDKSKKFLYKSYTKDLYEIDLNSAYWNYALKEGIITEEIFNYGNGKKIRKKARLVSLGALAKLTNIVKFDGKEYGKTFTRENNFSGYFFKCAERTIYTMQILKLICGENYFLYWCDAIIFQGKETLLNCENYLKENNIPYKVIPLKKLVRQDNLIYLWDMEGKKGKRMFTFNKPKKHTEL